ncbi:MAG: MgtC/SapB family protein [Alphaproteobacteria bacterium]
METLFSATTIPWHDMALRLGVAVALGAVLGIDRELRNKPAGLRTHVLVALAAAAFTVLTFEIFAEFKQEDDHASLDPIRIVEAVTAGVAFLAAGAIIQARGNVRGLTTGASMWLAGAIGTACGTGLYVLAAVTAGIAFVVLFALGRFEARVLDRNETDGG